MVHQAQILQNIDHQNICKLHEAYFTRKKYFVLVTEYVRINVQEMLKIRSNPMLGNLSQKDLHQDKLKSCKLQYLTEDEIFNTFTQMCLAIKHLQGPRSTFHNIKLSNFRLTEKGVVKLSSFKMRHQQLHVNNRFDPYAC